MTVPNPEPPYWPRGADEAKVRACNCDYCNQLIEALETEREEGLSVDGEHQSLQAIADGGDIDG